MTLRLLATLSRAVAPGLAALGLAAATGALAQAAAPTSRAQAQAIVRDAREIVAPRGLEQLEPVRIGGIEQWISVRGKDRDNPILLFIHGGPASPEMPSSWYYQSPWEEYFTVVQWDQRGAGKTYLANDPAVVAPTINVERMIEDGEEMASYLRRTYGKRKIFVVGHSWGTVIGLALAQRHPDWLHAYVGIGQFIDGQRNERLSYDFALHEARARHDAQAEASLRAIAPYPAADGTVSMEQLLTERTWVIHFGGLTRHRQTFDYAQDLALLSPDYTDADLGADVGQLDSIARLTPELMQANYANVTDLACPVFIFAGVRDFETPSEISAEWFSRLRAPHKELVWFERSAHEMQLEEPGKVFQTLVTKVLPMASRD